MPNIIGTAPNQVPTNADLGSMAYQDSNAVKVKDITFTGAKLMTAGGGSVVVQPTSSIVSDVTVNVPSVNGTLVSTGETAQVAPAMLSTGAPSWDSSGNLSFNSGYGSAATAYACRAWVNFNGTGTVAIRGSGNVSSITDLGWAEFDINFSNAMPDANYAVVGNASSPGVTAGVLMPGSGSVANNTTTKVRVYTIAIGGGGTDFNLNCVSIFR